MSIIKPPPAKVLVVLSVAAAVTDVDVISTNLVLVRSTNLVLVRARAHVDIQISRIEQLGGRTLQEVRVSA